MENLKLEFSDKVIEFSFGLGAVGEILEDTNCSMAELLERLRKNPFKFIPLMMFRCAEYANTRKGQTTEFNQFEILDLIEANGGISTQNVADFLDAFTQSLVKNVPVDEDTPEPIKGEPVKK